MTQASISDGRSRTVNYDTNLMGSARPFHSPKACECQKNPGVSTGAFQIMGLEQTSLRPPRLWPWGRGRSGARRCERSCRDDRADNRAWRAERRRDA